ncbi:MAG: hypothetical protein AAF639_05865 [Chloroflexota bacterium]
MMQKKTRPMTQTLWLGVIVAAVIGVGSILFVNTNAPTQAAVDSSPDPKIIEEAVQERALNAEIAAVDSDVSLSAAASEPQQTANPTGQTATKAARANINFDSGSDGSDGALVLNSPGTVDFFTLDLDSDGDGIYHFTTVTITSGVVVDMSGVLAPPVIWLATGNVSIEGTINLNGHNGELIGNALPGAGGYAGGKKRQNGFGIGGGKLAVSTNINAGGGGGGYAGGGANGYASSNNGGSSYGNVFILPLLGGSGGGGGYHTNDGGGGGGGGAILIASSTKIVLNGSIQAKGGNGSTDAGGGSGGAVRLVAPEIAGEGGVSTTGGSRGGNGGNGGDGRIRLEAFIHNFTGDLVPDFYLSTPSAVTLPNTEIPLRIVSVGGVAVPENPSGGFNPADMVINEASSTVLEIEAHGVPVGTVVDVLLLSETGDTTIIESTPLAGTVLTSTATATVTIPHGFSQFVVQADWAP